MMVTAPQSVANAFVPISTTQLLALAAPSTVPTTNKLGPLKLAVASAAAAPFSPALSSTLASMSESSSSLSSSMLDPPSASAPFVPAFAGAAAVAVGAAVEVAADAWVGFAVASAATFTFLCCDCETTFQDMPSSGHSILHVMVTFGGLLGTGFADPFSPPAPCPESAGIRGAKSAPWNMEEPHKISWYTPFKPVNGHLSISSELTVNLVEMPACRSAPMYERTVASSCSLALASGGR
mmetsp:Transcript_33345/g.76052  ORF Transcript_33345/g.76052 Transcript_33345/m.76052 type:complete len:238 (+) Transcript_33345:258-971(+)